MATGMRRVYDDLIKKIKLIVDENNIPVFQTVNVWNNQVKRTLNGKGLSFLAPACFVDIQDFSEELWGLGIATQNINITFHIIHEQLDGGDGTFDRDQDVLDIRTMVRKAFTQFNPKDCSSMMFQREKQDFDHNNLYHFLETFKCKYIDYSGCPYSNGTYIILPGGTWTTTQIPEFAEPGNLGVGWDIFGMNNVIGGPHSAPPAGPEF